MGNKDLQRYGNILYLRQNYPPTLLSGDPPALSIELWLTTASFLFSPRVFDMAKQLLAFPPELPEGPRGLSGDGSPCSVHSDTAAAQQTEIQSPGKGPRDANRKWEPTEKFYLEHMFSFLVIQRSKQCPLISWLITGCTENLYIKKHTSEQIGCEILLTYLKTNGKPTQLFCFSVLWK